MNILQFIDADEQALALANQVASDITSILAEKEIATLFGSLIG